MKSSSVAQLTLALSSLAALTGCSSGDVLRAAREPQGDAGDSSAIEPGSSGDADDTGGSGGTAGAAGVVEGRCGVPDLALADADADELFDTPRVPTFDLYLPPAVWDSLRESAEDEVYAEAEACFEGRGLGRVGLRFKGSYGSLYGCADSVGEGACRKLSMKLKFTEYVPEQRFYGLKRLNFNAYRFDDSRIKERLAYDLFRAMGIVAPRAAWAVLRINDESQGLFGMVEQIDGRFTADRWPENPDGNLYKDAWPAATDPEQLTSQLRTNEDAPDVSAFLAFANAMTAAGDDELRSTLQQYADLDYLARFLAVEDAVASYDGVTYFWTDGISATNHNYYVYEEAADRFTLIAWDVESTFWINPNHATPHWTEPQADCSLTYPYWEGQARAPWCDRAIQALAANLDSWRAAGRELLDGPFSEAAMLEAIDRHADFVRTEALADPTPPSFVDFDTAVAELRSVVPALRNRLEQLIAKP